METVFEDLERGQTDITRGRIREDLASLVRDSEDLLKATARDLGEKTKAARLRLGDALERAKASCHYLEERTVATAKAADKVIRNHTYESIGISFGIGLLVGFLITRK